MFGDRSNVKKLENPMISVITPSEVSKLSTVVVDSISSLKCLQKKRLC